MRERLACARTNHPDLGQCSLGGRVFEIHPLKIVVSPFQGLVFVILVTQGGAARLASLRCALGWCVAAPLGRKFSRFEAPGLQTEFGPIISMLAAMLV